MLARRNGYVSPTGATQKRVRPSRSPQCLGCTTPIFLQHVPVSARGCAETGTPIANPIAPHCGFAEMGTLYVARLATLRQVDMRGSARAERLRFGHHAHPVRRPTGTWSTRFPSFHSNAQHFDRHALVCRNHVQSSLAPWWACIGGHGPTLGWPAMTLHNKRRQPA